MTIHFGGAKSRGEDHHDAAALLSELMAESDEKKKALNQFRKIIAQKTSVSYSGDLYGRKDVDHMKTLVDRYREWVMSILPRAR